MKVIVICGPNLSPAQADGRRHAVCRALPQDVTVTLFPEAFRGAKDVRELVVSLCQIGEDAPPSNEHTVVIVTRYDAALFKLGELIEEGALKADDVDIHLWNEDKWLTVKFDEQGVLREPWPIGVLG